MTATGKRHDFLIDYEVGFDDDGNILGVDYIYAARCGFSSDLSGPVTDRALFHCDNAYFYPAVHAQVGAALHQHRVQHRLSRLRRAAGHGRRRARHRRGRLRASARTRSRSASSISTAPTRPQRHALPPDGRGQHHPPHRRRAGGRARDYARRRARDRGLQRQQPLHQARPGADAGQVRHLLHRHALQPGRRAGACLHRRLGASEPWRHRDGAGALRQGRAGGGRRVPDRPRPGEDHRDDDRQGAEHLGDGGLVRLRPQRHGGAERGAPDQATG